MLSETLVSSPTYINSSNVSVNTCVSKNLLGSVKRDFNLMVSDFVTRLMLESNNEIGLNNFLVDNCSQGADGIWRFIPS